MPLDGLTLGFLTREMQALVGGRIDRVTQPEKDMVVLVVRSEGRNARLLISASPSMTRFHLTEQSFVNPPEAPMFCMLLRKHLLGGRIQSVEQVGGDRLVRMVIDNRDELGESGARELWLEAMGRHSNLTLVMNGHIIDAIRHVSADMSRVRQALPGLPFAPPPGQDKLPPEEVGGEALYARLSAETGRLQKALMKHISGLSPVSSQEMALRLSGLSDPSLEDLDVREICEKAAAFFERLPKLHPPVLLSDASGSRTDFFPFPYVSCPRERQQPCKTMSEALDLFYTGRDRAERMAQRSAALKKTLKTHLERDEKKLALQEEELRQANDAERLRLFGELLSAQLYLVRKGARSVEADNYYDPDGGKIVIPLDETLSPAQNAQKYFRKYRKAMAARKTAAEQKKKTLQEIELLEDALLSIGNCETQDDLGDIRHTLEAAGLIKPERGARRVRKQQESKPYRFVSSDGMTLYVGKNSLQNERLVKSARGEDMWLHAKDMPGSHVIIAAEGRDIAPQTIMEAAKLAAFYSRGHGVSVLVDYTLRRHVKKPAGTPAGFVTFTNNRTLLVSASESEIRLLKKQE